MPSPPAGFEPLDDPGPFAAHVGPMFVRREAAGVVLGMHADERHANAAGTVHGGMLATLCDMSFGRAIRAEADEISGAVTVSLTTDYLAPAPTDSWLEAHTTVEKLGGRLAFADCSVTAGGREVVRARAVFSVLD